MLKVLIPSLIGQAIAGTTATSGTVTVSLDTSAQLARVTDMGVPDEQSGNVFCGQWFRCRDGALHGLHNELLRLRSLAISVETFLQHIDPQDPAVRDTVQGLLITYTPQERPTWAAWTADEGQIVAVDTEVVDRAADPIEVLGSLWPVADLASAKVIVVGAGSIGSATANALAMYGIRHIELVDDDRLEWRNIARHQATADDIGAYKVDAVANMLAWQWPTLSVIPLRLNVISDADLMRPLFRESTLVVCAADGVTARRTVSHLARRAEIPAILSCVLHDGAIGEIIRLRPWPHHGCLLCNRAALIEAKSMDPEPGIESDYGTGTSHRPMTAVGSDLALVGQLAAKIAVATLLEEKGHYDQRLAGEQVILGLRGTLALPPPFNVAVGETRWLPSRRSRPSCPTCSRREHNPIQKP